MRERFREDQGIALITVLMMIMMISIVSTLLLTDAIRQRQQSEFIEREDVVLVVTAERVDRRARWVKAFRDPAAQVSCDPPKGARAVVAFVRAEAGRQGLKLGAGAADALAERIGPQLLALRQEIAERSDGQLVPESIDADEALFDAGYVEAVAAEPGRQGLGFGTSVMRAVARLIAAHHRLGALSTGEHHFYERLGWERWQGPTFVRNRGALIRTPDEDDGIMVLRFGPNAAIDLRSPIVCEARTGDDW